MASSPETAPPKKTSNNSTSSPPSDSSKSASSPPPPSPTPSSTSPSHPPPGKSPPPSPPSSPPPDSKSPPPPSSQKSPPPSSPPPPPSSPPPPSPPPSSPPPSSTPTRSSPAPTSPPPPDKDKGSPPSPTSPPPDSDSKSSPPPPPSEDTSEPSSSSSSPSPSKSSPPPSAGNATPTPTTVFSPPPSINYLSPPGVPKLVPPPPRSSPPSSNSLSRSSGSSSNHAGIIAGGAVGSALVLAVMVVVLLCILRKRRKPAYYIETATMPSAGGGPGGHGEYIIKVPPPSGVMVPPPAGWGPISSSSNHPSPAFSEQRQIPTPISPNVNLGRSQFSYDELATATGGFSQSKLLGQGGFGYVYKGVLPNGQEVAVKSLKAGSGQGEREFQAEVEIISRVHHRHLVSLVGYCMAYEQRMLVYEFVPNGTLEFHLHGKGQPVMDWTTRLRIAVGSAKGLSYLHEDCHPRIIHRDIKAANILLDNNFEAMVADFGLAKLSSDNITHVSTRVMGTFGYLAPEYASSGKLTEKSDVFSFGVMLLELITGRRPLDSTSKLMEDSLVDWARPLMTKAMESGNYDGLVDPRLEGKYVPQELARMVSVAASSIRHSARMRPRMSQIVRTLEGEQLSLDDQKSKPGQSAAFGVTRAYDTNVYNADMMKFKKMVMSSQEFPSSEFGDSTSEYGRLSTSTDSEANYHSDNAQKV